MGYGDIVPVTDIERIFTLGVALIGAVVFSYCMGSVGTLISQVGVKGGGAPVKVDAAAFPGREEAKIVFTWAVCLGRR